MMKKVSISFITVTATLLCLCALSLNASAQYLVSSKAGFVNRAEGTVSILRVDSEDGQAGRASLGTQMRDGDRLLTDADARAEILLNPGSYLRLNEKSEVRAVTTSLSETRFELVKGSAIIEIGQIDKKSPIEIATPNGVVSLAKEGLLRIDAKTAATWIAVRQGEIHLGTRDLALTGKAEKIKRGKLVRLTGSAQPELAKVDKDQIDAFDTWSFTRAQTLVAANLAALRQNSTLSQMGWFYNSFYGCYTFVPRRGYLVSPYGFGFFRNWADCYWYNPFMGGYGYGYGYNGGGYYGNGGSNSGGVSVPNLPGRVVSGLDREPIRREIPAERGIITDNGFGRADVGGRSIDMGSRGISSSSSSTVSSPTVISSPAPTRSDSGGDGGRNMPTRGGGSNNN